MFTQVQASVEILSPVPVSGKCSEKDYERLFIRDPEVPSLGLGTSILMIFVSNRSLYVIVSSGISPSSAA